LQTTHNHAPPLSTTRLCAFAHNRGIGSPLDSPFNKGARSFNKEKEDVVLWKSGIQVESWSRTEFVLFVAGIRDNYPRLGIGDLVQVREGRGDLEMGSGTAFEVRIVRLRKREGFIRTSPVLLTPTNRLTTIIGLYCPIYLIDILLSQFRHTQVGCLTTFPNN
jgi:hypothetical protein